MQKDRATNLHCLNMFLFDWQILVKIIVGKVENVEYLSKLVVPPQSLLH